MDWGEYNRRSERLLETRQYWRDLGAPKYAIARLSVRFESMEEACQLTEKEILQGNFGKTTLAQLKAILAKHGLALKGEPKRVDNRGERGNPYSAYS